MMSRNETNELGVVEQQVMLAIMRLKASAYGISIRDELNGTAGIGVSLGSIYAALQRLESKGFVVSHQGDATPERGGRRKMFFEVTAQGLRTLKYSLAALDALRGGVAIPQPA